MAYCVQDRCWQGVKPGRVAQAWWLRLGEENAYETVFYALFRTTDEDTWLGCGLEDVSERSPHGGGPSDNTGIRWLVRLEKAPGESIGNYLELNMALALGGTTKSTMSGIFEIGEETAAYAYDCSLPDGGIALTVYRGGARGRLLSPDRSEYVERTALFICGPDELTEVSPGAGVYRLPDDVTLKYDGETEVREAVFCRGGSRLYELRRTVRRADGMVISEAGDLARDQQAAFFPKAPEELAGESGLTVAYSLFDERGEPLDIAAADSGR